MNTEHHADETPTAAELLAISGLTPNLYAKAMQETYADGLAELLQVEQPLEQTLEDAETLARNLVYPVKLPDGTEYGLTPPDSLVETLIAQARAFITGGAAG